MWLRGVLPTTHHVGQGASPTHPPASQPTTHMAHVSPPTPPLPKNPPTCTRAPPTPHLHPRAPYLAHVRQWSML